MVRRLMHVLPAVTLPLALACASLPAWAVEQAGGVALESRLYSPCCFGGTLDVHDSELARSLRKEIETRLARGDGADTIQADFVARYGERVIAARTDAPIAAMSLSLLGLMGAAGIGGGITILRWVRRGTKSRPAIPARPGPRDAFDERLDAELAEIE